MRRPRALIALLILLIALPARAFELPGLRISHPESGDIQGQSGLAEVRELSRKYRPGDMIARVPSSGPLAGRRITIRDVMGKVYNDPPH